MKKEEVYPYIERLERAFYTGIRLLGRELCDNLSEGLTPEQYLVLRIIDAREKVTVSELAEVMGVKPSAITSMIDRVYRSKLVNRYRDERDRRVVFISLSDQGKRILHTSKNRRDQIIEKYVSQIEFEELDQFVRTYEKIVRIITEEAKIQDSNTNKMTGENQGENL